MMHAKLLVRHRIANPRFQAASSFVREGPLRIIGLGPCNAEQRLQVG